MKLQYGSAQLIHFCCLVHNLTEKLTKTSLEKKLTKTSLKKYHSTITPTWCHESQQDSPTDFIQHFQTAYATAGSGNYPPNFSKTTLRTLLKILRWQRTHPCKKSDKQEMCTRRRGRYPLQTIAAKITKCNKN